MTSDPALVSVGVSIVSWLVGKAFGRIRVLAATSEVIDDVDGFTALDVTATVTDPPDDTWPDEDVANLRRALRTRAQTFPESPLVYLSLRPETEETEADDVETIASG